MKVSNYSLVSEGRHTDKAVFYRGMTPSKIIVPARNMKRGAEVESIYSKNDRHFSGRKEIHMENVIRKYASVMKELGITGLEVPVENDQKVRIEMSRNDSHRDELVGGVEDTNSLHRLKDDNYYSVKSPIVGVFYAGPAENAGPFVAVNDRVVQGTTLCIIESMKLMNEILSEEPGIIDEVCVENGQLVEYGTELFRIKR